MIALLMPLMQMFMLGYGVSLDVKHIPLCAYDREGSQHSQALLKRFAASQYFDIVDNARQLRRRHARDRRRRLPARHRHPAGFLAAPERRRHEHGAGDRRRDRRQYRQRSRTATRGRWSPAFPGRAARLGRRRRRHARPFSRSRSQARVWFNEDLESRNFIIPGRRRPGHGDRRRAAHLAHHRARMGARHDGAAGLHAGDADGADAGQAHALFRPSGCSTPPSAWRWRCSGSRCRSAAAGHAVLHDRAVPVVVLGIGYLVSVSIRSQVGASQVALLLTMLPDPLLSGFAFPDRPDAGVDAGDHLSRERPLLRDDPEGGLPEGRRARRARRADRCLASMRSPWSCSGARAPSARRWTERRCSPHPIDADQGVPRAQARPLGALPPARAAGRPDAAVRLRGDVRGIQRLHGGARPGPHPGEPGARSRASPSSRFEVVTDRRAPAEDWTRDRAQRRRASRSSSTRLRRAAAQGPDRAGPGSRRRHQFEHRADRARLRRPDRRRASRRTTRSDLAQRHRRRAPRRPSDHARGALLVQPEPEQPLVLRAGRDRRR